MGWGVGSSIHNYKVFHMKQKGLELHKGMCLVTPIFWEWFAFIDSPKIKSTILNSNWGSDWWSLINWTQILQRDPAYWRKTNWSYRVWSSINFFFPSSKVQNVYIYIFVERLFLFLCWGFFPLTMLSFQAFTCLLVRFSLILFSFFSISLSHLKSWPHNILSARRQNVQTA